MKINVERRGEMDQKTGGGIDKVLILIHAVP